MTMDISVVVPLYNEEESLPELCEWIVRVMNVHSFSFEILFVNDGSTDNSWNVVCELKKKHEQVRGISFRRNYGKSAALHPMVISIKMTWLIVLIVQAVLVLQMLRKLPLLEVVPIIVMPQCQV